MKEPNCKISETAKNHIICNCEDLSEYITNLPTLELGAKLETHPVNAVVEIIIGQMLSVGVARSMKNKANKLAQCKSYPLICQLTYDELLSVGLSRSKAKSIKGIHEQYEINPKRFHNWINLDYDELNLDMQKLWGVSDWTISILSLFYFGNPDIFPYKDGSIQRATKLLNENNLFFDVEKNKPYRSYLALYLWAILDENLIAQ